MSSKLLQKFLKRKSEESGKALMLPHKILVGTHHKTGTAWMRKVFESICNQHKLFFYIGDKRETPSKFDVLFQNHSLFDLDQLDARYKGLHIIRDPRDRVISGCFYHQKSDEEWLHVPRKEFGHLTYQEKINSYDSIDDQIMFEMENSAYLDIKEMLNWNYSNQNFIEIKYEDLIEDADLLLFHKIFTFLGFPGESIPDILRVAYNKSLFSGRLKPSVHVRNGQSKQWQLHFNLAHKTRFIELFDNAVCQLGYEENSDWVCSE